MSHLAGGTGVQRNIKVFRHGRAAGAAKPIEQMSPREARAATPRAQLDVTPNPQVIPAKVDRDWPLVEALRRRESTAPERLLETYGDRVYRLAMRITRSEQDAEEVVQDAFWNVVRNIDTFRGESLFGSWIYRITANAAYQKLRRTAHRRDEISLDQVLPTIDDGHHHVDPSGDWSAKIDAPAIQRELRGVLASAIDELPATYRAVIVLHDVEGLSMAEVADALGITAATAKTRAHRARLRLRHRLGRFLSQTTSSVDVPSRRPLPEAAGCHKRTRASAGFRQAGAPRLRPRSRQRSVSRLRQPDMVLSGSLSR
jgi:RNA polymerase sigma-70 factor, ECF subfamily